MSYPSILHDGISRSPLPSAYHFFTFFCNYKMICYKSCLLFFLSCRATLSCIRWQRRNVIFQNTWPSCQVTLWSTSTYSYSATHCPATCHKSPEFLLEAVIPWYQHLNICSSFIVITVIDERTSFADFF